MTKQCDRVSYLLLRLKNKQLGARTSADLEGSCGSSYVRSHIFVIIIDQSGSPIFRRTYRINLRFVLYSKISTCFWSKLTKNCFCKCDNCLDNYCKAWGLTVNLEKSKVLIFRNGGRLTKIDRWWFGEDRVEVVNKYKYLYKFDDDSNIMYDRTSPGKIE